MIIKKSGRPSINKKLSPSEINILNALEGGDFSFTELKHVVKNRVGKPVSDRGLSLALRRLQELKLIQRQPSRKYSITVTGRECLQRSELIRSIESKPIYYSKDLVLKINGGAIYNDPRIHLNMRENFPIPIPVQISFFGDGKIIEAMLEFAEAHHVNHDRADIREFPRLVLEENVWPLKPYLIDIIFYKCARIAELYGEYKFRGIEDRPQLTVSNILNFDWGLTIRFEGKQMMDKIAKDPKLYQEVKERLVSLILLNLPFYYIHGCDFIIPAMVEGKLLDEKEGKELQQLYEEIHGKCIIDIIEKDGNISYTTTHNEESKPERREEAIRQFLIKALEHARKGDGLYFAESGRHGIRDEGLTRSEFKKIRRRAMDDIFNEIIERIKNPPEPIVRNLDRRGRGRKRRH